MQLSYRVIKNSSIVKEGNKTIITDFKTKFETQTETKQKELGEINAKNFIDSYENLAKTLIEDARRQREAILSAAYAEAEKIEKEAFEKGYREGNEKGYNDGFNKAYQEGYQANVDKAMQEGDIIKKNADNILRTCIAEKEKYIVDKENEIKNLIINCIEDILKREVKEVDGLNNIVFEALSKVKTTSTFIIKSKGIYCEEFKKQVNMWKEQLPFRGDIFIIPDESLEEGTAIIERDNGKVVGGVDIAMEKVKEIINSVE